MYPFCLFYTNLHRFVAYYWPFLFFSPFGCSISYFSFLLFIFYWRSLLDSLCVFDIFGGKTFSFNNVSSLVFKSIKQKKINVRVLNSWTSSITFITITLRNALMPSLAHIHKHNVKILRIIFVIKTMLLNWSNKIWLIEVLDQSRSI